jgi:hypothetical protein
MALLTIDVLHEMSNAVAKRLMQSDEEEDEEE